MIFTMCYINRYYLKMYIDAFVIWYLCDLLSVVHIFAELVRKNSCLSILEN